MKKEWFKHYVLAFIFIAIIIIAILMIIFEVRIVGFVTYAQDGACGQTTTENSDFGNTQLCNLDPNIDGPNITANNVVLDCKNYTLTGEGTTGFGIKTNASNSIIKNCPIKNFKYNLNISGENATVVDTNLSGGAGTTDDAWISPGLNATFLNVTWGAGDITISAGSNLFVQYYLTVNVTYSNSSAASGASVGVYNESVNATKSTLTTDSNGIARFNVTDYLKTSVAGTDFIYIVNATAGGNIVTNSSVNISGNTVVLLTINDTTFPSINLTYPLNTSYAINVSWLNYTVSDNIGLSSCWYSLNNGLTNTSVACGTNATGLTSSEGSNTWRVYTNDTNNNVNSSNVTFFKDTIIPNISITYPQNSTNHSSVNVNVNYTIADSGAGVQACWYTNNSGLVNRTITCGANLTTQTWNEASNTIIIYVNDSVGNVNSSFVTFSIDTVSPNITLISPSSGTSTTTTSQTFSYNVSDASIVSNCSLILNGAIDQTNTSISQNSQQNFSKTLSVASYTWSVNCTDNLNNRGNSSSWSLTITSPPGEGGSTTGGGGGGSSCLSRWVCDDWSECVAGIDGIGTQNRTCTDLNKCFANKKLEKRNCVISNVSNISVAIPFQPGCRENWTCNWTKCVRGWQKAINCTDINKCGTNAYLPVNRTCIEKEFPLPNINMPAAVAIGTGAVVIISFLWLWWLLLALIPVFLLRLRHYCISLIDFDNLLKLDNASGRRMFVALLNKHENPGLSYAGLRNDVERYLLERGFVELQFSRPCIINAHFSSLHEAKMFRRVLIDVINEFGRYAGIDLQHKYELIHDIMLKVETQSFFSALRAWRRKARSEKMIRRIR